MRIAIWLLVAAAAAAPGRAGTAQDTGRGGALGEDERIVHFLNRFTLGATPELVREVREAGIEGWLSAQLAGDLPENDAFARLLERFETIDLSTVEIFRDYNPQVPPDATRRERAQARRKQNQPAAETLAWVLARAVYSRHAVREVSCDLFRNHFSVSLDKGPLRMFVIDWEREVLFKRALGSFGDMLEASAKHPAMLLYLDNHLSRRPATPEELEKIEARTRRRTGSEERAEEALEIARQRGLNENYARELLELHTLGVDNHYTQQDVIEVAKCLTGWSVGRASGFQFHRGLHCEGPKTVLGTEIPEDRLSPIREGEQVLQLLKTYEGTARFLAWKMCRWFVRDEPDEAMVGRIAGVFRATQGDLARAIAAIVADPGFWDPENFRAKYKRPFEYVVSALRATGAEVTSPSGLLRALAEMNEPLYRCADPTGYYDQAEAWRDPGALAYRWAFAQDLVGGRIAGVRIPASLYADLAADSPGEWKDRLVARLLPAAGVSAATSAALDRLIEERLRKDPKAGPARLGPVIAAAILGSPEFQKQ